MRQIERGRRLSGEKCGTCANKSSRRLLVTIERVEDVDKKNETKTITITSKRLLCGLFSVPSSVVAAVMNAVRQSVLVWPFVWTVAKSVCWLGHADLPSPQRRVWSKRMLSLPSSVSGQEKERDGRRNNEKGWKEGEESMYNPEPRVNLGNRSTNTRHFISKCPNSLFYQD